MARSRRQVGDNNRRQMGEVGNKDKQWCNSLATSGKQIRDN